MTMMMMMVMMMMMQNIYHSTTQLMLLVAGAQETRWHIWSWRQSKVHPARTFTQNLWHNVLPRKGQQSADLIIML